MEKSKDVKRRYRRAKPFQFTPEQIARFDREEERGTRARQIRERDARLVANKKKKAEAEAKARTERRARGIPDPNIRIPSSQPLLSTFLNAKRHPSPGPVEAIGSVADANMDIAEGAYLSTDRVRVGGTVVWDGWSLHPKPQRDPSESGIVCDGTDSESGLEASLDNTIRLLDEADESYWRSSPPVRVLDMPAALSVSSIAPSADPPKLGASASPSIEQREIISAVQSPSLLSSSQRPPSVTSEYIPPSYQRQSSPFVSGQRMSPDGKSPAASSQFDPTDFLIAEATGPVQPAIAPDSTDVGGCIIDGVQRRLSIPSSESFGDDTTY